MDKPRFPLSVSREFLYRAVIEDTGEIIECWSFKTLFRVVRSRLRCEVYGDDGADFKIAGAVLEYGFHTSYRIDNVHSYGEWKRLVGFGYMYASSLSEVYCRFQDNKQCILRGGGFV